MSDNFDNTSNLDEWDLINPDNIVSIEKQINILKNTIIQYNLELNNKFKKLNKKLDKSIASQEELKKKIENIYNKIIEQDEREKNLRIRNYYNSGIPFRFMSTQNYFPSKVQIETNQDLLD